MAAYHTSNPKKSKMLFASQILESRITLDRLHVLAIYSLYFSLYTGGIHVPCLWYKANKTSDGKHVAMSKSNLLVENYNLLSTDGQRQQFWIRFLFWQITVLWFPPLSYPPPFCLQIGYTYCSPSVHLPYFTIANETWENLYLVIR